MTTNLHDGGAVSAVAVPFSDEQAVVLHVRGGDYVVPISRVQEIVRVPPVTHIPEADPDVEGVINLRGKVLTLLAKDMEPPSPVRASRGRRSIHGMARIGEPLILLMDLNATLATLDYGSVAAV